MAHLILQVKRLSFCSIWISVWSIFCSLLAGMRSRSVLRFVGGFFLTWSSTANSPSTVLILSHSFVRRLSSHLSSSFNTRASEHFLLLGNAIIHLHGVGGRTVEKLRPRDPFLLLGPGLLLPQFMGKAWKWDFEQFFRQNRPFCTKSDNVFQFTTSECRRHRKIGS